MKRTKSIFIAISFFIIGFISSKYITQKPSDAVFHLKDQIILYQDGNKIGELYSGAILNYVGEMDEGFQQATLLMNYYEKPDSIKYYFLEPSQYINPKFPCWNSKDVQPSIDLDNE